MVYKKQHMKQFIQFEFNFDIVEEIEKIFMLIKNVHWEHQNIA